MLDGIDNNTSNVDFLGGTAYVVKPPVDAIAEIKVLTSSFSAEYGRAGGAVLSATLKSGSNEFHGSAWEFNRNDSLKAAEFFENARGLKKGRYDSNQFGFTAGQGFFLKLRRLEVVADDREVGKSDRFQSDRGIAAPELIHGQASFVVGHWR